MRNRKSLPFIAVLAGALLLSGCAANEAHTDQDSKQQVYLKAYNNNVKLLQQTATDLTKVVNPLRKGHADTPEINSEYDRLQVIIKQYSTGDPIKDFRPASLKSDNGTVNDMNVVTQQKIQSLQDETQEWASSVDDANDVWVKQNVPQPESPEHRIERLQHDMGMVFPFQIKECSSNLVEDNAYILGCYNPGDDFYTVTPSGLAARDCALRTTLAHEYHHMIQWREGLMTGTHQATREWLEADARNSQWLGGGC